LVTPLWKWAVNEPSPDPLSITMLSTKLRKTGCRK